MVKVIPILGTAKKSTTQLARLWSIGNRHVAVAAVREYPLLWSISVRMFANLLEG